MNIFDKLYTKILSIKEGLNKNIGFTSITIDDTGILKRDYLDFKNNVKMPLASNSNVIYLYDDVLRSILINNSYRITPHTTYTLLDFMEKTKTWLGVFSNNKLVDPTLIRLYITGEQVTVLIINEIVSNVTILMSKGIVSCKRYNSNSTVILDKTYQNSCVIFTDGYIDFITPTVGDTTITYTLPAQGKTMVMLVSYFIKCYQVTPLSNSQYNYINFPNDLSFISVDYTSIYTKGAGGYIKPTEYTPLYDGFKVADTTQKIIVYYIRTGIEKYEDIRTYYNSLTGNYINQLLNGTLPTYFNTYTPYEPVITDNMSFIEQKAELIKACKDLPYFYKTFLEEKNSFNLTSLPITAVVPEFKRNSIVDENTGIDVPRFIGTKGIDAGLYIEEAVTNVISDSLFNNGIATTLSNTQWSIPNTGEIVSSKVKDKGLLYHLGIIAGSGSVRLNSPKITIDKTKDYIVQFKIKYRRNISSERRLVAHGGIVDNVQNSILSLESYKATILESDGYTKYTYTIPANTFQGSTNEGYIGLWSGTDQTYENVEYHIKDFQMIQKNYPLRFYPGSRAYESFKITQAPLVLSAIEGMVEMWVTPKTLTSKGYLLNSNLGNVNAEFSIYIDSTGAITFELASNNVARIVKSNVGLIAIDTRYHIAIGWKNQTLYGYVNGVLIGSAIVALNASIGTTLMIGSKLDYTMNGNSIYHDIRFSSVLRLTSAILATYNSKTMMDSDTSTTYKFDFNGNIKVNKSINHPTIIQFKMEPRDILIFNNGLIISPSKVVRQSASRYDTYFRAQDIVTDNINMLDIGPQRDPFCTGLTVTSQNMNVGPSARIKPGDTISVYTDANVAITGTSHTIDTNLIKLDLGSEDYLNQDIYVTTQNFNKIINKPHSPNSIISLPFWANFISTDSIMTFVGGRLIHTDRAHIFSPLKYKIVKGETPLALDLDTDVGDGETIDVILSSQFKLIEHDMTVTDGEKIISLTDDTYPFSTKYNLVFIDGKLISPDKIKIVDFYRFSVDAKSINDIRIYRKNISFEYETDFDGIIGHWTEYLATLSVSDIEDILGPMHAISAVENNTRVPYYTDRHLYEILYWYTMRNKNVFTDEDNLNIRDELPEVFLDDGRLPISSIRGGKDPRYVL